MQVYEVTYIGDDGMDKTRLMACDRIENLFGFINSKVWCETVKIIKKLKVEMLETQYFASVRYSNTEKEVK